MSEKCRGEARRKIKEKKGRFGMMPVLDTRDIGEMNITKYLRDGRWALNWELELEEDGHGPRLPSPPFSSLKHSRQVRDNRGVRVREARGRRKRGREREAPSPSSSSSEDEEPAKAKMPSVKEKIEKTPILRVFRNLLGIAPSFGRSFYNPRAARVFPFTSRIPMRTVSFMHWSDLYRSSSQE
jgi:hypothetical protein